MSFVFASTHGGQGNCNVMHPTRRSCAGTALSLKCIWNEQYYTASTLWQEVHHMWVSRISPMIWLALCSALTIWAASRRRTATCSDSASSWLKQSCL